MDSKIIDCELTRNKNAAVRRKQFHEWSDGDESARANSDESTDKSGSVFEADKSKRIRNNNLYG